MKDPGLTQIATSRPDPISVDVVFDEVFDVVFDVVFDEVFDVVFDEVENGDELI